MLRAFGAGFGTGTVSAEHGVATLAMDAVINNAKPLRMPRIANCSAIRNFGFLFKASSCLAPGHFIVLSAKGDMVFP
jgi:hypothetical protein